MSKLTHEDIVAKRVFPHTGTYIGTVIEAAEPKDKAQWYQWNQAKMAAHAVRYGVITSSVGKPGCTSMVEHVRPDSDPRVIDVYANPRLGILRHIVVLAAHIGRNTDAQFEHLGIEPEQRPLWLPLGRECLRKVKIIY